MLAADFILVSDRLWLGEQNYGQTLNEKEEWLAIWLFMFYTFYVHGTDIRLAFIRITYTKNIKAEISDMRKKRQNYSVRLYKSICNMPSTPTV